ncbi:MAG: hypothetical protein LBJ60_04755, partial [Tannerellaceae bacterium]|nr:hypothetical protein [Tannerellaceae bacterium]
MDKERKEILPLNWQKDLKKNEGVDIESIDDDLLMFDNINRKMLPAFSYPFKLDVTVCIIV